MVEFHNTKRGVDFYENHIPRLVNALERLANALEKSLADLEKYEKEKDN